MKSQETIVQSWGGRVLVSPQGISLSSSLATKSPHPGGSLHPECKIPGTLPCYHQPIRKKVTHPAAFIPNLAYKNFSLKTIGEFWGFEYKPPVFPVWSCNKPFFCSKCQHFSLFELATCWARELSFSNSGMIGAPLSHFELLILIRHWTVMHILTLILTFKIPHHYLTKVSSVCDYKLLPAYQKA